MEKAKLILGIDPGTRITGYGLIKVQGNSIDSIAFGCIQPYPRLPLYERYLAIFNSLEDLLGRYNPTEVAIESQFVNKNAQSALKLGMAKGAVILAAAKKKIPIFEYAPKKAKQSLGNGRASKEQVQRMIQKLLNLQSLPSQDAADALAIAICHSHQPTLQKNV